MAVYIDKEKLLKDIESTVLFTAKTDAIQTNEMRGANKVIDRIKAAPAEDVVEVVRCKDCERYEYDEEYVTGFCFKLDKPFVTSENHYCSHGRKRRKER